ncbi:MAG: HlyC/CorC family transporter [Proteobacteria bacterium]|nr:HlyC/CorC family transporter [Pseudomonadota bacterium]
MGVVVFDAETVLRLVIFVALLVLSGFFASAETALFSISSVQQLRLEEEGHPAASRLRQLLARPRRLIATIFIGNEMVNVGASALMAALASRYLEDQNEVVVTVVSTSISVMLILLFGEIVPKNLAARIPERWALASTRPIAAMALVMAPLRLVIERIADAVVYLVGDRQRPAGQRAGVSEGEFRAMVDVVSAGGELDRREMQLIHNVFDFGERRVADVMTPAARVFALPDDLSLSEVIARVRANRYSRIPVYHGSRDRVVGILLAKDLIPPLHAQDFGPRLPSAGPDERSPAWMVGLQRWLRPPYFVPRATKCVQLLHEFRRRRAHQAIVVDEYGRFSGLVTMEDLLEEMFGEIRDEKEIGPPRGTARPIKRS